MNLNELLKKTLKQTGLPICQDEYTGTGDRYILFNYTDERPALFADNRPGAYTVYLNLQLITPKGYNYFDLKKRIRALLEKADFTVRSVYSFLGDTYQGTEKKRQTVFDLVYIQGYEEE